MAAKSRTGAEKIEAIPENLFREPIDYLYADHYRQRVVCGYLDEIARGERARPARNLLRPERIKNQAVVSGFGCPRLFLLSSR